MTTMPVPNSLDREKIVVLSGAGLSASSGLSTFRDSNGLWENHRIEDVASPDGWKRNPEVVLRFYNERRESGSSDAECGALCHRGARRVF